MIDVRTLNVNIKVSICNWNELRIEMSGHPKPEKMPEKYPLYVFPKYTNRIIEY